MALRHWACHGRNAAPRAEFSRNSRDPRVRARFAVPDPIQPSDGWSGLWTRVALGFGLRAPSGLVERLPDLRGQVLERKRLGQEVDALVDDAVVNDDVARVPRHEDDLEARSLLLQRAVDLSPV